MYISERVHSVYASLAVHMHAHVHVCNSHAHTRALLYATTVINFVLVCINGVRAFNVAFNSLFLLLALAHTHTHTHTPVHPYSRHKICSTQLVRASHWLKAEPRNKLLDYNTSNLYFRIFRKKIQVTLRLAID